MGSYTPAIQFEHTWSITVTEGSSGVISDISIDLPAKTSTPWQGEEIRVFIGIKTSGGFTTSEELTTSNGWYEVNGSSPLSPSGVPANWTGMTSTITDTTDTTNQLFIVFTMGGADIGLINIQSTAGDSAWLTTNAPSGGFSQSTADYSAYFYTDRSMADYAGYSGAGGYYYGSYGINCLLEGTKILTPFGYKLIEELKEGDTILNNLNEEKKIKKTYYQSVKVDISNPNRDLYQDKYFLKNSDNLIVSGGHMIKVGNDYHLPINSDLFENIQTETSENHYYHLELDNYDYFIANGVEVESLCREENQSEKEAYYTERGLSFQDLIKSKK